MEKIKSREFNEKYLTSLLSLYAEKKELIIKYKTLTFNELGINSLGFVKLLVNLEQKYRIDFSDTELVPDHYKKLQDLVDLIQNKLKDN